MRKTTTTKATTTKTKKSPAAKPASVKKPKIRDRTTTTKTKKSPAAKPASVKKPEPKIRDRYDDDLPNDAADVILSYQRLDGRYFSNKFLRLASFVQTSLRLANFSGADCTRVCFAGSDLTDADFSSASLREADLTRCLTLRTNFKGAFLDGALVAADFPIPDEYVGDKHETLILTCLKLRKRTVRDDPSVGDQIKHDAAELREARVDYLEAMRAQGYAFIGDMKLLGGGDVVVTYRTAPGVPIMRELLRIHWAFVQKLRRVGSLKRGERVDFLALRNRIEREYPKLKASLLMREESVHQIVSTIEKEAETATTETASPSADPPVPLTIEDEAHVVLERDP